MTKRELKLLLKLNMKQAIELLELSEDTDKSNPWERSEFENHQATLFQVFNQIRKNSIKLEKVVRRRL